MDRDPFDLVGAILDGRFRVLALAGRGELRVIYKGHHLTVDAPVAITCLDLPVTLDSTHARPLVEKFREGSRLHTRLARGHGNIAQSFAFGSTRAPATGTIVSYLVREWFEGESLAADLARRRAEGKKGRTLDEVVALLQPAVEAIAYAHSQRSPHLALDPSHLFLAERSGKRSLRVADFGIARAIHELARALPPGSRPVGSPALFPAYAAPEQRDATAGNATAGESGAWTDVYAVAVLMMELLSDRATNMEPWAEAPGDRAGGLGRTLQRAVAREPGARQKDMTELWNEVTASLRRSASPSSRSTLPPAAVGAVPGSRRMVPVGPSMSTLPMGFDRGALAGVPAPPRPVAEILPPVILADDPPSAPPAYAAPAAGWPPRWRVQSPTFPILERRSGWPSVRMVATALAALIGAPMGVGLVVALKRQTAGGASVAPAPLPAYVPPPPTASTPDPDHSAAQAIPSPVPSHFAAAMARQALDAASHGMNRCKLGKRWGGGTASVNFGNDGSVSQVTVGFPFTATATGRCVSDLLGKARTAPFEGKPGLVAYRFFVPPR